MPNHVTNILSFSGDGERIGALLKTIKPDKAGGSDGAVSIDFNKIIPMPEALNMEAGSQTDRGIAAYREFIKICSPDTTERQPLALSNLLLVNEQKYLRAHPEIDRGAWELGKKAWHNIQTYGAQTWYDWCVKNWGTKWNAYDPYGAQDECNSGDALTFMTAWSAPEPVMQKLSEMFPDVAIEHKWADEDLGSNCGERTYLAGEVVGEYYPEDGDVSKKYAAEILGIDLEDELF